MGSLDAWLAVVNVEAFVWRDGRYLMVVRGADEEIAPGTLTPPGGKVEPSLATDGVAQGVLEETLRREVLEETGLQVADAVYVESHAFPAAGAVVVDVVFLCRYASGEARAADAAEVAGLEWLTPEQIVGDVRCMAWTRDSLALVEEKRRGLGW